MSRHTRTNVHANVRARVRADDRPSPIPLILMAAALVAAVMMLAPMVVHAAGSSSEGSSSGGSGYSVNAASKEMRKAQTMINKEDYAGALAVLETETTKNPDNADAWNLTGFASRKLGDYVASEAAYDKALAIDPKHKGALEYKGELYLTLGNLAGAEALLARLSKACSFNCEEKKELSAAIEAFKKAN